MMPTPSDEAVAKVLWDGAKAQAIGVAKLRGHALGQKQYTPDEELLMWNREAEGWTPEKELALLAEGKSRETVGLMKYPERQKLAESGERALSKYQQATFAERLAKRNDPSWSPSAPPGAGPPPLPDTPMPAPESSEEMALPGMPPETGV